MSKVDLHIHTTASDGRFSPEEIVRKAVELGLEVIALADHDCVDGIVPALKAAKKFPQLRIIPAVEVSTEHADMMREDEALKFMFWAISSIIPAVSWRRSLPDFVIHGRDGRRKWWPSWLIWVSILIGGESRR